MHVFRREGVVARAGEVAARNQSDVMGGTNEVQLFTWKRLLDLVRPSYSHVGQIIDSYFMI